MAAEFGTERQGNAKDSSIDGAGRKAASKKNAGISAEMAAAYFRCGCSQSAWVP